MPALSSKEPSGLCRQQRIALALACTVTMFGVCTVASVIHDPQWLNVPRDLDLVELWTEAETLVRSARGGGLQAEGFDILQDSTKDFTTFSGFSAALKLVMRLKPGGLLAMAPDCSSFVFGPSSQSGRKKGNFEGDTTRAFVQKGNLQATVAGFFLTLAIVRELEAFIENPSGSTMFSYLASSFSVLAWMVKAYCDRCQYVTAEQRKTQNYKKHYKFVATSEWILSAMRTCSCKGRHMPLMDQGPNGEVNGRQPDMKLSGIYPEALGAELVKAWRQQRDSKAKTPEESGKILSACPLPPVPTPARSAARGSGKRALPESWESPWSAAAPSEPPAAKRKGKSPAQAEPVEFAWGEEADQEWDIFQ